MIFMIRDIDIDISYNVSHDTWYKISRLRFVMSCLRYDTNQAFDFTLRVYYWYYDTHPNTEHRICETVRINVDQSMI